MASPQSIWGVRTEAVSVVIDREALRGVNLPDALVEVWYEGEKGIGKGKGKFLIPGELVTTTVRWKGKDAGGLHDWGRNRRMGKDGKGWTQNAETQTTTTSTATTERGVQTDPWTWAACLTH